MTWTLLALGTALAAPRRVAPRADDEDAARGAQRPSPRAGRRGAHRCRERQPLRAAGRAARAAVARASARRACSSGRSRAPIPTTTPTTTWSGAASCSTASRRRSRPTPRRPSTRSTSRSARVLGLVFGESADRALVLVCLLSHAALVFGTYRLGAAVFGRWSGALAALFVAASASFLLYAARGYVDAPFLALVVWAGVLRSAEGRAPRVPRRCSSLAGLLRPEAWVLGRACWLWLLRDAARRVAPAALARRRRAGHLGAHRPGRSPATRCTRCTRRPSSPTTSAASAGSSTCPARSCRSSARPCARRSRCWRPSASCSRGACLGWRRCACRWRCSRRA